MKNTTKNLKTLKALLLMCILNIQTQDAFLLSDKMVPDKISALLNVSAKYKKKIHTDLFCLI